MEETIRKSARPGACALPGNAVVATPFLHASATRQLPTADGCHKGSRLAGMLLHAGLAEVRSEDAFSPDVCGMFCITSVHLGVLGERPLIPPRPVFKLALEWLLEVWKVPQGNKKIRKQASGHAVVRCFLPSVHVPWSNRVILATWYSPKLVREAHASISFRVFPWNNKKLHRMPRFSLKSIFRSYDMALGPSPSSKC